MRQIHKQGNADATGKRVREPLAETVIRKSKRFTKEDIDYILKRRVELEQSGLKDKHIADRIAVEMGRSAGSARAVINKLVRNGKLAGNRNKGEHNEFSEEEIKLVIRRRGELERKGMNDEWIGKKISEENGRSAGSIKEKIRELVRDGRLGENSNKIKIFSEEDVALIIGRRIELEKEELNDSQIAKRIAGEMGRSAGSVRRKIRDLLGSGRLVGNTNRRERFSDGATELIMKRRAELEGEGFKDKQIVKKIADEIGKGARSVESKLRQLVRGGRLAGNKHKLERKAFGEEDIALIIRRRTELEREGMNDGQTAKEIAGEIGRSPISVADKIRQLVRDGRLPENANKVRNRKDLKRFSEEDVALIIRRRIELEKEGMNDDCISKKIAEEMGGIAKSIERKIRELVRDGRLGENGHKRKKKEFTDEDVALVIRRRIELEKGGMTDRQAADKICGEMKRNVGSIKQKIRALIQSGRLPENGNKEKDRRDLKRFSEEDVALIIRRRIELEKEGMADKRISEKIAEDMGRNAGSVIHKIHELVRCGRLDENKNKREKRPRGFFTEMSDEELIKYAKSKMTEGGVSSRKQLANLDGSLYFILLKRGLMDEIFAGMEARRKDEVLGQLREAVDLYTGGR